MAEKIEFDLEVRKNELDSALDSGTQKANDLQDVLKTAAGVFAGNVATKGLELLGRAIDGVVDFANESIDAFSEQEDALNRLSQALKASGDFSESAVSSLSAFAGEIQKTTKFSDDLVLSQLAVAKSFGATNEGAKNLITAAANLSATFGGSLEENVVKLGKTLSGEIGRLGQLVPQLKELTQEQLRTGEAANIVNERFGGAAAADVNTYAGSIVTAANAFNDLQEEIGGVLVDTLGLGEKNGILKSVYEVLAEAIRNYRIEQDRAAGTIVESAESVDQLQKKLNELNAAAIDADQIIRNPSFFDNLLARPTQAAANLKILNEEIYQTELALNKAALAAEQAASDPNAKPSGQGSDQQTKEQQVKNAQILALREQLAIESESIDQAYANRKIENELVRNEEELKRIQEFERQKIELDASLKEETAAINLSGSELDLEKKRIQLEKELALKQSFFKLDQSLTKTNADQKQKIFLESNKLEQQTLQARLGYLTAFTNLGSALAEDGSREQFLISKAGAIAQSIVATNLAAAQALAVPPAPNLALASTAQTLGAINTAAIAATAIKGFAGGGVIGATIGGDNRVATVRDGEMVLNADQQKILFDAINGGSFGGGDIIVQVDGREIARAVRTQVQSGFKIGA